MTSATGEDLFILAPQDEDIVFKNYVRCFVDAGVAFPFGDDYSLPRDLPADLSAYRCIVIDPRRADEFEREPHHERLLDFRRAGGYVHVAELNQQAGGVLGDSVVRHRVARVINTAGFAMRNPALLARMQAKDEAPMIARWKAAAPDELAQYERMKHPFGDPTGYITFRAAVEAAEFFSEPALAEPLWAFLERHVDDFGRGRAACGGRWFLRLYERTGDARFLDAVRNVSEHRDRWRLDGVMLNQDLRAPEGCDRDDPPPRVRENAWTWPETAAGLGDTNVCLSQVTGDPRWTNEAVTHVLGAHRWLFAPNLGLWYHVGRPDGPDRRSAPWGRGNAWFLYGVRGLLDDLPGDHPQRGELIEMLRLGLEGLRRRQNERGLWHNVLDADDRESRECASATSRFIHVYARAYHRGWLRDERIPPMVERAWLGLKTKIWDWALIACCVGTSHALVRQVYLSRPHDTFRCSRSSLLLAWMEIQRMKGAG